MIVALKRNRMRIAKLLQQHEDGQFPRGELIIRVIESVTSRNVREVMSQVPDDLTRGIRSFVERFQPGATVLDPEGSDARAKLTRERLKRSVHVLHGWFARRVPNKRE